ncbi:glycosyl transferase family 1 [Aminobacter sp. Y103A]|jgi:succinoglycan biosynthesis protein ExoL|uniref:Succinoglycan biosynthesis protein ExoL n=1 Tax=Aminobacter aminovorans TaxID=83263 RepID=A0AAC8YL99_AMIAI|nr:MULTISPECIES: glycosyltransferase family 1 protein [Aminobacter]AMS39994.1 Glycosyltransferase, succinoglycan biosynthesis protein ExoL [Aminobacter aminovorans]MBB3709387.1 succinoglycan biosynthesis protein ExoL [Aminobacter aminovorans]BBD40292.1 glycosyl transferase family 1 [Aminobacter sp. SS-2016]
MLHVLYLVHDVSDPAVRRRIIMLKAGGARVTLAGFRRTQELEDVEGVTPIDLGHTRDGRFAQRLGAVAMAATRIGASLKSVVTPDVIVARNLEMLALAQRARSVFGASTPIVYECLDIHRLVLREDFLGKGLRGAERLFGRNVGLLLTSSPAFVRHYFERFGQIDAPIELVENKLLELEPRIEALPSPAPAGEPWTIGWFGALRCRKSLELLAAFSRGTEGRFKVVLRGRPALSEFPDFHGFVASEPHLEFKGAYRNPEDMVDIYAQAHFAWAIDFFEEGQNSTWLLPNRLYESCRFGTVPIAMAGTETARFLERLDIGLMLPEPSASALAEALSGMTSERYAALRGEVLARDPRNWICDLADCRALVAKLERVAAQNGESPGAIAA